MRKTAILAVITCKRITCTTWHFVSASVHAEQHMLDSASVEHYTNKCSIFLQTLAIIESPSGELSIAVGW